MSTTPVFSSNISEHRWIGQLDNHFVIYINNRPSIFQVPKGVCDTNPAAYSPQQIGIGAYHHFRPDLVEMDGKKVEAVEKFLEKNEGQLEMFKSLIVDKVKALEPSIRSSYNKYLDLDGDTLAWIMAIDGVYLLHLLSTYPGKKDIDFNDRVLAQDILMLENQLPCIVLKEIKKAAKELKNAAKDVKKALQPPEEDNEDDDDDEEDEDEDEVKAEIKVEVKAEDDKELFSEMLSLCKAHSPLDLTVRQTLVNSRPNPHLLSYMYNLITFNWSTGKPFQRSGAITDKFLQAVKLAGDLTGQKHLLFLANLPVQQFLDLFKKDKPTTNSSIEEIRIPSASQLHKVCKVQFQVWPESGIGVKYLEEQRTLFLPVIKLNADSEVILRNLVAYEVASGSNSIVSGFVDFMCGLIDTAEDVRLLKDKDIIQSQLSNEVIAGMFNGINQSNRMRTEVEEATKKLNVVYDSRLRVKAGRFIRNHCVPSENTVKIILSVLVVGLLTLQAFCQVYGCSAHWFGSLGKINSILDS